MSKHPVSGLAEKMADFYFSRDSSFGPLVFYGRPEDVSAALDYAEEHFRAACPEACVRRFTAEQFFHELIRRIRDGDNAHGFVQRLGEADLFVLDGLEAVSGMAMTQEELYWLLDALYEHGRRIVIGMAMPPKDVPALEDRVRALLEGGLLWGLGPSGPPPGSSSASVRSIISRPRSELTAVFR